MRQRKQYPDWVERFRAPDKEIKEIGGRYYLYDYEYKMIGGKSKKCSGSCLGTIKEKGLVPSVKRGTTIRKNVGFPMEYGASFLLENMGKDILENLKEYFDDQTACQIFEMGKIGLISPSPFKRMDLIFSNSYGYMLHKDLPMSPSTITSVLKNVGNNREAQLGFMRKYYDGTEYVIFDGTRLVSHSIGEKGYNHCGIDDPQMNLQYCFSLAPTKAPIYFRALKGNRTGVSSLKVSIAESGLENVIFIADKGYYSKDNADDLTGNGIQYIMPVRRNDSRLDYSGINLTTMSGFNGYFRYHSRPVFYKTVQKGEFTEDGNVAKENLILFYDEKMRGKEMNDSTASENKTMEDLSGITPSMGTISLASTVREIESPQKIYETYKERELIEDANDAYKHVMNKNASSLQDLTSYYGWLFINHITLLLYYRVYNAIKARGMTSKVSVADAMENLKRITIQTIAGEQIIEYGAKVDYKKMSDIFGDSIPKE